MSNKTCKFTKILAEVRKKCHKKRFLHFLRIWSVFLKHLLRQGILSVFRYKSTSFAKLNALRIENLLATWLEIQRKRQEKQGRGDREQTTDWWRLSCEGWKKIYS
jgi:hypothetical protein